MLIRRALEADDLEVTAASRGDETLSRYAEIEPDLVVLDIGYRFDGLALCSELRKRHGSALAPVVMLSAVPDPEARYRCYEAGATDFLEKPIEWRLFAHRTRYLVQAQRAFSELQQSRISLENAQRIAHLGTIEWCVESDEMLWSDETFRILGLSPGRDEPNRDLVWSRIHPEDKDALREQVDRALREHGSFRVDHRIVLPGGEVRHLRQSGEVGPRGGNGSATILRGTIQDVTEHARAMDQIRYLANYDGLTGLSNRRHFMSQLRNAIDDCEGSDHGVGLLFMDLDRFKRINDSLGHTAGDQLLQSIASRILKCTRRGDTVSRIAREESPAVSRLGGDEFTVLLSPIESPEHAGRVAERILEALPDPVRVDGHEVTVSGSIGVALYPQDGEDVETLVKNADAAMYQAKARGGNNYQFFAGNRSQRAVHRLALESRLRDAIDRDEFLLHFQPKVDLRSGTLTGMEALVRWEDPDVGTISPGEFIPLAEESGLIVRLGSWVLQHACQQNKAWQDAGLMKVPVAVNVSSQQLAKGNLGEVVRSALQETGLPPEYLELEITESTMMEDEADSAQTLGELKELGVQVALDDFGTGYSSLSYVKRFPLDKLKIDRSFVFDLPDDSDAAGIVAAIIAMAHVLDLRVVAEGVETIEQAEFLRECFCDEIQGFLISAPVADKDFVHFLDEEKDLRTG